MILDGIAILILVISVVLGKRTGLFRAITRLISSVLSIGLTMFLDDKVLALLKDTPLYTGLLDALTKKVEQTVQSGKLGLIQPFMTAGGIEVSKIAERMASSIFSVLIVIVLYIAIKLVISVLDKTVFHLPLIKPINGILGCVWNLIFTLVIVYLAVGICGGLSLFSTNAFLAGQMESSVLVRGMFTNNIVLNFFMKKG